MSNDHDIARASPQNKSLFNFSAASTFDNIVYGSERPGFIHSSTDQPISPREYATTSDTVEQWIDKMCASGIRRVICLLSEEELNFYDFPLIDTLKPRFSKVEKFSVGSIITSFEKLFSWLKEAEDTKEPVVVHCSKGQGRTGNVLALWLNQRYHISINEAISIVNKTSRDYGAIRKPTVGGVVQLLVGVNTTKSGVVSASAAATITAPKDVEPLHVAFIQMGGTIDKDYPVQLKAYGFVIKEAASIRVLSNVSKGFTFESISVCKKDSQEITNKDRDSLLKSITNLPATKIIVTHGTDTMIETAQYIGKRVDSLDKTIVFTGAIKPQKLIDSDAAFNIGCSIGAINTLSTGGGVYFCMNGRVMDHRYCKRNVETGLFF